MRHALRRLHGWLISDVRQDMKLLNYWTLFGTVATFVIGSGLLARRAMLDEAETLERAAMQIAQHPSRSLITDAAQVRIAIYAHYVGSDGRSYLVEESDEFVRALRARTGAAFSRLKGDTYRSKLSIHGLQINEGISHAVFQSYAGDLGMELFSVRLKREKGAWIVVHWRLEAVS